MVKRVKLFWLSLILLLSIFSVSFVSAAQISLNSENFYPGETFIAHINGNFTKEIKQNNIFFLKDNSEVSVPFYLTKISPFEYLVYVNLPRNPGEYKLAVKNMLYYDSGTLSGEDLEVNFILNEAVSFYYLDLGSKTLSSEVGLLSLEAAAFFNSDSQKYNQAKSSLLGKATSDGCWPSPTCKTKETSLALLALAKSNSVTEKMKNWLLDSENDLSIGLWELSIDSSFADSCSLNISLKSKLVNISKGTTKISLDTSDLNSKELAIISLKCNTNFQNPKIIHTYLGKIHEFPLDLNGNYASISLNNKKCFGTAYRGECDNTATAYALLAFNSLSLDGKKTSEWLEKNSANNFEKAVVYLFTKPSSIKSYLDNNQANDGYWPEDSLAQSSVADNLASVLVSYALKNKAGESWIKNNLGSFSEDELCLALSYLFPTPEKIISVSPVYFKAKTNSNIYLTLENKGTSSVNVSILLEPFNTEKVIIIEKGKTQQIELFIPSEIKTFWVTKKIENETYGNLSISYVRDKENIAFYKFDVLITPSSGEVGNISIEEGQFNFYPLEINVTLLNKQEINLRLKLRDLSQYALNNISFIFSRDLYKIVNITPAKIDFLAPGTEKDLILNLNVSVSKNKNYTGYIEARSDKGSAFMNISIYTTSNITEFDIGNNTIIIPISNQTNKSQTCSEMKGTICGNGTICKNLNITQVYPMNEATGKPYVAYCCHSSCVENKNYGQLIGISMILGVIIILVIFFSIKMRKPKKNMQDVVSNAEKAYFRPYKNPDLT